MTKVICDGCKKEWDGKGNWFGVVVGRGQNGDLYFNITVVDNHLAAVRQMKIYCYPDQLYEGLKEYLNEKKVIISSPVEVMCIDERIGG